MYSSLGGKRKPDGYVVTCKRCRRHIHAGCSSFPASDITVTCPLCGDSRRYRCAEVFLGWADQLCAEATANELRHITAVAAASRRKPPTRVRILLNYVPNGKGYIVQAMADDCKTPLSRMIPVDSRATLIKLVRYIGAAEVTFADFEKKLNTWSQGSVWIDHFNADGARLLRITQAINTKP